MRVGCGIVAGARTPVNALLGSKRLSSVAIQSWGTR